MSVLKSIKISHLPAIFLCVIFAVNAQAQEQNEPQTPVTAEAKTSAVSSEETVKPADKKASAATDNSKEAVKKQPQPDERTAQEKIAQNRRALNLSPPKAPKSLGGGNGNGGLGSGQITVSSN
ncbi:hypothetical protein FE810_10490 [Thalassotalea litorea]|uniref:Uncharacterized protein n=1 Tax=Thalassotalea litorea TaxID=2020715 RepID=A0A5R9IH81_9GAMM|nr:hypothetical protein [Thalassotalea litorea]TLU64875.1 hypothetical protein FE810_10490 [Thalassotalea litorea]